MKQIRSFLILGILCLILCLGFLWPVWATAESQAIETSPRLSQSQTTLTTSVITHSLFLPYAQRSLDGIVDQGTLADQFLAVRHLDLFATHQWSVTVPTVGEVLTIYVASTQTMDLAVKIVNPADQVVLRQNNAPAGAVEVVTTSPLSITGTYRLYLYAPTGTPGDYAMIMGYHDSYPFILKGTLQYGDTITAMVAANTDHFWHFSGTAGDNIAISITPDPNGDVFLKLYDPSAEDISGFVNNTGIGEAETYTTTVPTTGFYSIRTGEFDFAPMAYTLTLTISP